MSRARLGAPLELDDALARVATAGEVGRRERLAPVQDDRLGGVPAVLVVAVEGLGADDVGTVDDLARRGLGPDRGRDGPQCPRERPGARVARRRRRGAPGRPVDVPADGRGLAGRRGREVDRRRAGDRERRGGRRVGVGRQGDDARRAGQARVRKRLGLQGEAAARPAVPGHEDDDALVVVGRVVGRAAGAARSDGARADLLLGEAVDPPVEVDVEAAVADRRSGHGSVAADVARAGQRPPALRGRGGARPRRAEGRGVVVAVAVRGVVDRAGAHGDGVRHAAAADGPPAGADAGVAETGDALDAGGDRRPELVVADRARRVDDLALQGDALLAGLRRGGAGRRLVDDGDDAEDAHDEDDSGDQDLDDREA